MLTKRSLGRTGESLSIIGFGGVVVMDESPAGAERLVAEAIERGINYFDVAPSYGNAEQRLGPALAPFRDGVFLACKTTGRSRAEIESDLHNSLRTLRTDCIDLYQLHAVNTLEEIERIVAPGGALEALADAQHQGKVRFLGFSSHAEHAALALLACFPFDTVLFPFNWVCWHRGNFGQRLLQQALEMRMGVLGLKALARGKLAEGQPRVRPKCWYRPTEDPHELELALRFALSLPITATVSPGDPDLLWRASDCAEHFRHLTSTEQQRLHHLAADHEPLFATPIAIRC